MLPDALGLADELMLPDALGLADPEALALALLEGVGLSDALLLEPPEPGGISAVAVVAQPVAASTAAIVEQARRTRPLGEFMKPLEQPRCPSRNGSEQS